MVNVMIVGFLNNREPKYITEVNVIAGTRYEGIQKLHVKSEVPKRKTKKNPLTKEDKKKNQELASERVAKENVIGVIKGFKIVSDKYWNRRKRFGLRINLISVNYNMELQK
jgi:hypothetical protein